MSYGQFLAIFLCIPLVAIGLGLRRHIDRFTLLVLGGLSMVALAYTAPWDNLIVIHGVWSYAPHQILGVVIGHVPLEEYVFYALQVCLIGLVTIALLRGRDA